VKLVKVGAVIRHSVATMKTWNPLEWHTRNRRLTHARTELDVPPLAEDRLRQIEGWLATQNVQQEQPGRRNYLRFRGREKGRK